MIMAKLSWDRHIFDSSYSKPVKPNIAEMHLEYLLLMRQVLLRQEQNFINTESLHACARKQGSFGRGVES